MNDKPLVHIGWLLATYLREPNVACLYNQTSTILNDGGANAVRRLSLFEADTIASAFDKLRRRLVSDFKGKHLDARLPALVAKQTTLAAALSYEWSLLALRLETAR
jgi:hypothetical protein